MVSASCLPSPTGVLHHLISLTERMFPCTCINYNSNDESKLSLSNKGCGEQYGLNDNTPSRVMYGMCELEWVCTAGHSCDGVQAGSMVRMWRVVVPLSFSSYTGLLPLASQEHRVSLKTR